ncbi:MPT63 family protein [Mycobacterium sp. SMC-4]|uniref:MPT63 family protein n=1 Tax=Mycobacterium sp. SMC-4 TaxID=2857059 RepID=UPI0021B1D436|nr:MPT63 family protein [Mycobacterium sp. SMC-4]UXA18434.1 MPT63 family protein [Mycobacterium sp. SMC-4]
MRLRAIVVSAIAGLIMAALTVVGAPNAAAAYPTTTGFGDRQELVDAGGEIITGYTVTDLRPSNEVVPWPVAGQLWEATVKAEALRGDPQPIVASFNARAANGENYQHLFAAASPGALGPEVIAQGHHNKGKLYFDVVGMEPNSVVYNSGVEDLLIWVS